MCLGWSISVCKCELISHDYPLSDAVGIGRLPPTCPHLRPRRWRLVGLWRHGTLTQPRLGVEHLNTNRTNQHRSSRIQIKVLHNIHLIRINLSRRCRAEVRRRTGEHRREESGELHGVPVLQEESGETPQLLVPFQVAPLATTAGRLQGQGK
jgi:hypothetical protein